MKLFLIDGHALIFKMYYAFLGRPMVNSKGIDTSILFGFTKYLLELIEREKPTHIAVSFDPPGGTFRNQIFPEYKANRTETPQLVIDALEPLTDIVESLGIPVLMIKGFEADDVIGSAAKKFAGKDIDVYMVTPDKDYGQLVDDHIFQYRPGKGGEEAEIYDTAKICEKYGLARTEQVIDLLTLCGDTADNVPGVQGIGPVSAAKLLARYGTVENIYAHQSELTQSQQEKLRDASGHISLSKILVTIKTDIPLAVTLDQMKLKDSLEPGIITLLEMYEMRSLKKFVKEKIGAVPAAEKPAAPAGCSFPVEEALFETIRTAAEKSGICALCTDEDGAEATIAVGTRAVRATTSELSGIISDPSVVKRGFDLKKQAGILAKKGILLKGKFEDIELMHYLLNPERSHSLANLSTAYLGVDLDECQPASTGSLFDESPAEDAVQNVKLREAVATFLVGEKVRKELDGCIAAKLYDEIEEPLARVLLKMEQTGVRIETAPLMEFAESLRTQAAEAEARVRELGGDPSINVASPKQIGELIFEKMKLDPKAKKPARGSWPTDEETLQKIDHPIIGAILDYRGTRKLLSTYIEPLPRYINPRDGRVHTTFNQALTSTGRLSSSNPNLQNIPVRTEQGREIRKAFTAPEGSVIMSADYSQIELRIMAHLCGDGHMRESFLAGQDIHAAMAARIYHKLIDDVTPEERRVAKTANFGIMYGISAFGLAQRLRCSRTEAAQIIEDYFASFPSIRLFIDRTLADARKNGYVETIFGRRRYVPEVNSPNGNIRAFAERNAVNAPIQGSAADIIKLAMIEVDKALTAKNCHAKMVLQIHDELVLEVPEAEIDTVRKLLVESMETVVKLSVPLTAECNYGKDWLEAH